MTKHKKQKFVDDSNLLNESDPEVDSIPISEPPGSLSRPTVPSSSNQSSSSSISKQPRLAPKSYSPTLSSIPPKSITQPILARSVSLNNGPQFTITIPSLSLQGAAVASPSPNSNPAPIDLSTNKNVVENEISATSKVVKNIKNGGEQKKPNFFISQILNNQQQPPQHSENCKNQLLPAIQYL